jgi:chromosome segregation protein
MVRAFAADAPPAKLAFYSPPRGAARAAGGLPRLADLLRLHDAGLKALLADWLAGCYTAPSLDEALARAPAAAGEAIYVPSATRDRAQRELLRAGLRAGRPAGARAGDRAPGQAAARPGADRRRGAHALVRAEAAYADASQRLVGTRREAARRSSARELQVETLRLASWPSRRARSQQIDGDLAEVDAQLEALQSAA